MLSKPYETVTKEEKIAYNVARVTEIIDSIHNSDSVYCAEILCYECPCNVGESYSREIICITRLKVTRGV